MWWWTGNMRGRNPAIMVIGILLLVVLVLALTQGHMSAFPFFFFFWIPGFFFRGSRRRMMRQPYGESWGYEKHKNEDLSDLEKPKNDEQARREQRLMTTQEGETLEIVDEDQREGTDRKYKRDEWI